MDSSNATSSSGTGPQPRKSSRRSLREVFESLPLAAQFRVTAIAAVTVTLLAVQVVIALWDTRFAREEAIDLASSRTASMAARLEATGGGALDNLEGHPELLAATFRLQGGDVLQSYYRDAATASPGSSPPAALAWTSKPTGVLHWIRQFLALEPIYVESSVQLSQGLNGTVSILVDHHWIWNHAVRRAQQTPVALLLGFLVALVAANMLRRQVVEPLALLARTTRVNDSPEPGDPRKSRRRRNELTELATNFEALADRLVEYEGAMSTLRHASSQQIIERTRELEQRLRRAEALTRSKDDFLANMSHEIRTPMNGVLGMAELLAGTELDKRQRRFVDSMRAAAETMMRIINDILDDSKIEAGKMDLVQEPFDVRELAEQAGQLYAGQAESKKLEMICRIEPTVPSIVVGDALRLRQVLGNLLSNAVKYTDHGEIEIRVGLDDSRDDQCRLHFSIRDTGPGIPAADHTGVFEAFTQLDNGSRTGGTGLGLSIANRLVRLMGGEKIALASEVGRGSTFSFVLPFEIKVANAVPNRASDEFSGLRVLVVDDNATSYMLLEEMLSNWSVEVSVLNRAKLVGDRMHDVATRGRPFDIVLLDHNLPDATTEQLLRTIRLDPAIAGTYVVLLSALDFNASYEGTQAIAPDVCIAKPVREQLLRSALEASRQPRKPFLPESAPVERVSTTERGDQPALGLNVLVADDNAINREVAVAMLEELDCTVVLAEDGRVAVANAQQRRFDAILMDCQMPGMDGYAATEAIRRHESERGLAPTTIIALTANVMARDRERCLAAGMNAFLAKPFKGAQLLEVLRPLADGCAASSPAPAEAPAEAPEAAEAPDAVALFAESPPPALALTDAEVGGLLETPVADAAPISRLPVLDLEQVQAIRGLGKPLVFERLCEMLFSSSKDAFARLDTALAEGNLDEVAAAAHAFRSPVSNLGGRRLADLLERCETAALEGADLATVRRAATGLKPHYAALVAALEVETRRGTGTG
jgi:two-component system, sensor histidine kinase and response regulator